MRQRKSIIVFGILLVVVSFGIFSVVSAQFSNFKVDSVDPSSGVPDQANQRFPAVIKGDGFGDPRTTQVSALSFDPPQEISATQRDNHSDNEIPIWIRINKDAFSPSTRILTVQITGSGGTVSDTASFRITGGGSGGGGGTSDSGSEFVEGVPDKFGPLPDGPQSGGGLVSLIEAVTDWVFVVLLLAAVFFILLAAFQFIAGGGNATAVGEARQKLVWAAVGIVVAVLAKGLPIAIRNIVGGGGG